MKMKKWLILLAMALCLTTTAGCSAEDVLADVAQRLSQSADETQEPEAVLTEADVTADGQDETAVADTDSQAQAATGSDAQTQQQVEALPEEDITPVDFTALSASECIEQIDGLPYIMLACDGADAINQDIEGRFSSLANDSSCTLAYQCYKGAGRVLSILIIEQYDNDCNYYTPYNLDLQTGQQLSGQELLSLVGLDTQSLSQAEISVMGQEFEYEYGAYSLGDDADFYQEQYDRTVAQSNVDTSRLWFGYDGSLHFIAKIYAMAGAEYYEYPMSTGYSFS